MVKREEMPRPTDILVKPAPAAPWPALMSAGSDQERRGQEPMKEEPASIGKSIVIKGELSGGEDLTIEGQVEGKIDLRDQVLTIGSNGAIRECVRVGLGISLVSRDAVRRDATNIARSWFAS